ncbi:sigma-70 family RNA polymerase sigma factor [Candidatus Woesearchaeota archaeon]|nr:sigma-70 family RNA polymerase sigma factor [Candidatus Woesearchaeota archaeon]
MVTTTLDTLTQDCLDQLTTTVERLRPALLRRGYKQFSLSRDAAEDCAQETYLRVLHRIASDDGPKIFENLPGYIWASFPNVCRDYLSSQRRAQRAFPLDEQQDCPAKATPLTELATEETVAKIQRAVALLPEKFRSVFRLYAFENLSYVAIAQQQGVNLKTTSTRLHRARAFLREHFGTHFHP